MKRQLTGFDGAWRCPRCGRAASEDALSERQSESDPLRIYECPSCGSILDIGARRRRSGL